MHYFWYSLKEESLFNANKMPLIFYRCLTKISWKKDFYSKFGGGKNEFEYVQKQIWSLVKWLYKGGGKDINNICHIIVRYGIKCSKFQTVRQRQTAFPLNRILLAQNWLFIFCLLSKKLYKLLQYCCSISTM